MKLLRHGLIGQEKPGIFDDGGNIRDLSGIVNDIGGITLLPESLGRLSDIPLNSLPIVSPDTRIGPCVAGTGKFLCIGLNYADHAAESNMPIPKEPVVFSKATSAICGPYDNIVIPKGSTKTDWEVELGVVIGTAAKRVSQENALKHVAGYCIINDLSERDYQLQGTGQWIKGKSCDTFGPIGPWLVTADEIPDPQNLQLQLEVDGHCYQKGNTNTMVFIVDYLV
ncbi:MAG: fumarylacetoacetate hydrolase family protein, partial [Waddliaceae bacterium]